MKFPRRTRLLRNPFEATAYASVFFLLVLFLSLGSRLYTPGVRINLPEAANLPGTDQPTITVAMDANGQYYFQNQIIGPADLKQRLAQASEQAPEPLTLVIMMDKAARFGDLQALELLAREAGFPEVHIATASPATSRPQP
jgi:biopolymer transport protein ExbD